jgi:hypothetical protein
MLCSTYNTCTFRFSADIRLVTVTVIVHANISEIFRILLHFIALYIMRILCIIKTRRINILNKAVSRTSS